MNTLHNTFLQNTLPSASSALSAVRFACQHQLVKLMLWVLLIFAAVALFINLVFWWPVHKQYYRTEEAIAIAYKKAAQQQRLAATAQAVQNAQKQLLDVEKKFTTTWNQASLVAYLDKLAHRHHVTIIDQRYTQQQNDEDVSLPYTKISQDLLLEGRYQELRKFIAGLTLLPGLNIIRSVNMERTGKHALVKTWLKIDTLAGEPETGKVRQ